MTSQFVLEFAHRPAFGADDFLVAPSNEAAIALLDRWPDWSASAMLLHGPPGCGKTHLAHVWQARSGALLRTAASLTMQTVPTLAASSAVVVEGAEHAAERPLLHFPNLIPPHPAHLLLT